MTDTIQVEIEKAKHRGAARVKKTAEVFTPYDLCLSMVREIPDKTLRDPSTTYLDNSCGDGNFLCALFEVLANDYGHDGANVLNFQLYGVDLMPDNVAEAKRRLGLTPDMPGWHHVVCADGLSYDYSFLPISDNNLVTIDP